MAQLGWIGLGNMGLAMATNLQIHLDKIKAKPLVVQNRTKSRTQDVVAQGAVAVNDQAQVVQRCDIIFSCVSPISYLHRLDQGSAFFRRRRKR